jgi:hypothetical protein
MTNGAETPKKKGLPTLAWVGIGCGVLILIVVVVLVAGSLFVAKKVKDVAGDFEDNPGLAAARMIVRFNPELEEVAVDEDAGTMTIRNTKTGEEITVDVEDIKQGRLSWTAGGQEVTIDASGGEDGTVVDVKDGKESWKLTAGAGAATKIPEWVPVYPGTEPGGGYSTEREQGISGVFQLETDDAIAAMIDFYRSTLEEDGFNVNVNTFSGGDGEEGGLVNATSEETQRTVTVMVGSGEGQTTATVTFNEGQ